MKSLVEIWGHAIDFPIAIDYYEIVFLLIVEVGGAYHNYKLWDTIEVYVQFDEFPGCEETTRFVHAIDLPLRIEGTGFASDLVVSNNGGMDSTENIRHKMGYGQSWLKKINTFLLLPLFCSQKCEWTAY